MVSAEAAARDARRAGESLVADAESVARRLETGEKTARRLAETCEEQERELEQLRAYVRAQREDLAEAMRLVGKLAPGRDAAG